MPVRSVRYPSSCTEVPIGWVRADGPVRREGCVRAFGRRFLRKVKMTGRKASAKVRQLSDTRRYPIGTCSQTALLLLRQLFDNASTGLRQRLEGLSKDSRRTVGEPSKECRSRYCSGNQRVRKTVGRQSKKCGREWVEPSVDSLYFSGLFFGVFG